MRLECVVVSVGYSDFLCQTIIHNRTHFDKMVVVTDLNDEKTKTICDFYNVECVQTNSFYENGNVFNKANGINAGLERLKKDDWVLHLDADIVLTPLTRSILEKLPLDKNCIYGVDRYMCQSFEDWQDFLMNPALIHSGWVFVNPAIPNFSLGYRLSQYFGEGYQPIGFFQLWNPKKSKIMSYPNEHGAADRTDILFCKNWKPEHRRFIPDFCVIHLESEKAQMAANWNGRKTQLFTYKKPKDFRAMQISKHGSEY